MFLQSSQLSSIIYSRLSNFFRSFYNTINFNFDLPHYNIYTHNDGDGITSRVLMERHLNSLNISFKTHILEYLSEDIFRELKEPFILLDLGSNISFNSLGSNKIIDHHTILDPRSNDEKNFINPYTLFNKEIAEGFSTSALIFLLMCLEDPSKINNNIVIAYLGLLSDRAKGDVISLIEECLTDLEYGQNVNSIDFYGLYSKNLGYLSKYQKGFPRIYEIKSVIDSVIPEELLETLKWEDLVTRDQNLLISVFNLPTKKRFMFKDDLIWASYNLDPQETVTLVNSFCRLQDFDLATNYLQSPEKISTETITTYRKKYSSILKKAIDKVENGEIQKTSNLVFTFFNYESKVNCAFVGILASILSKDTLIGVAAEACPKSYKLSFRIPSDVDNVHIGNLMLAAQESGVAFSAGGHPRAGGSRVNKENLTSFLLFINNRLSIV